MKYYKNRGRPIASWQTKNEGTILARNVKTLVEFPNKHNTTTQHTHHKQQQQQRRLEQWIFFQDSTRIERVQHRPQRSILMVTSQKRTPDNKNNLSRIQKNQFN